MLADNPVGTGFSFTEKSECYARDEDDVARDLHQALSQFFTLFESYQPNDFYATGESYAGKYVPAISLKIHQENQKSSSVKINMKVSDRDRETAPVFRHDHITLVGPD